MKTRSVVPKQYNSQFKREMYRTRFGTKKITNMNVKRVKMVSKISSGSFMQKYSSNNIMMNMPEYNRNSHLHL